MLSPFHLRPYIGNEVRIESTGSTIDGTLTDVDRRAVRLVDVTCGWQEFAEMTIGAIESFYSPTSAANPSDIIRDDDDAAP